MGGCGSRRRVGMLGIARGGGMSHRRNVCGSVWVGVEGGWGCGRMSCRSTLYLNQTCAPCCGARGTARSGRGNTYPMAERPFPRQRIHHFPLRPQRHTWLALGTQCPVPPWGAQVWTDFLSGLAACIVHARGSSTLISVWRNPPRGRCMRRQHADTRRPADRKHKRWRSAHVSGVYAIQVCASAARESAFGWMCCPAPRSPPLFEPRRRYT